MDGTLRTRGMLQNRPWPLEAERLLASFVKKKVFAFYKGLRNYIITQPLFFDF